MKITLSNKFPAAFRDPAWWLKFSLAAGALLMAVYIGMRPHSQLPRLVALLTVAAGAWILLNRYPAASLIALVPLGFLVERQLGTGTNVALNSTFLMTIALVGVWLARMLIVEREVRLVHSPLNLPAVVFIAAVSLAWVASFLPWLASATEKPSLPAQLGAYLLYVLSIAVCLVAANTWNSRKWVRAFTWVYMGFATLYFLVQVIPWSFDYVKLIFVDVPTGNAIYWALLASMSLGQALFNQQVKRHWRFLMGSMAVLAFIFILARRPEWLAGWLSVLIAIFVLIWLWDWRFGILAGVPGIALVWMNYASLYARFFNETQIWSSYTRVVTWPIVWELFKANPISGLGPANYHYYVSNYSFLGFFLRFNTHNNYFDILLQAGLIGLLSFLWLVAAIFLIGWRLRKSSSDGFTRGYANGMLAALVAVMASGFMADYLLPFVYNIGINGFQVSVFFWLFAGGLVSLYAAENKQDA